MDLELSDEQRLISVAAREFCDREIAPRVRDNDRAGCVGICDGCVDVERYLRDARVTTLYEGTSQIQKLIIGRAATGVNAMLPFEES